MPDERIDPGQGVVDMPSSSEKDGGVQADIGQLQDSAVKEESPERVRASLAERERFLAEDMEFAPEVRLSAMLERRGRGHIILWGVLLFVMVALGWSSVASLDEVVRGSGKVVPSSQLQIVQNLEGGIVAKILVKEGAHVNEGQALLQIDDTMSSSSLREGRLHFFGHEIRAARLKAESDGTQFIPPEDVMREHPKLVDEELRLYQAQENQKNAALDILRQQVEQRQQELEELRVKRDQLKRSYELLEKELGLTKPLIKYGAVSEVEVLRLEREVNDIHGELKATELTIPRARSKLAEANKKIEEETFGFRNKARQELTDTLAELSRLKEANIVLADRLDRTLVRSPIRGTVKRIMINTIGGVIQPGMNLMEIVPSEDTLLVEARIKPSDIAFIYPGQDAMVKFSAYDYAIYGGVKATVEHIGADTVTDDNGSSFYVVRLQTEHNHLGTEQHPLKIIPGMTATVDIMTGKKTVLAYLLKPVLRAKEYAFKER